jgi:hypothetical protein
MKHRVHRAALGIPLGRRGPAPLGVALPGSSSAWGERGLNGETGPRGEESANVCGSGPAPLVPDFAAIASGSLAAALGNFTALELEKIIPVFEAAGLNNQHEDTFRRNFPHLIRRVGKRKTGVKLRDAITLPAP